MVKPTFSRAEDATVKLFNAGRKRFEQSGEVSEIEITATPLETLRTRSGGPTRSATRAFELSADDPILDRFTAGWQQWEDRHDT